MITEPTRFTLLGSNATVDSSWCSRLFVDRRKDPLRIAPQVSFPKPFSCFIGRTLHNKLLVNSYHLPDPSTKLQMSAPGGREFVRCDISEGNRVFVNVPSLIAWSDGIRLKTHLSLEFGAMAIGKLIYVTASGPGTILFELHGRPLVVDAAGGDTMSLDYSRIVAWDSGSQFAVTGSVRMLDIYLSQLHLLPLGGGKILVDSDAPGSGSGGLIRRFFKTFYLPR
jgi:hypothetical protein